MRVLKSAIVPMMLLYAASMLAPCAFGQERRQWTIKPPRSKPPATKPAATDVFADDDAKLEKEQTPQRLELVEVEPADWVTPVGHAEIVPGDVGIRADNEVIFSDDDAIFADDRARYLPYQHQPESYGEFRPRCRVSPYWVRADYLLWWIDGANVPVLITTSSAGTDRADAGVLGLSSTRVLLGNETIGDESRSGARIEFGRWLDGHGRLGWQASFFGLDSADDRFRFDSATTPILARPFFNVEPGAASSNADLIGFPGEVEGNATVTASTSLVGAEFMLRHRLINRCDRNFNVIAGYQYASLEDDLTVNDFKRVIGGGSGLAIGTTLTGFDRFRVDNQFSGAAVGFLSSTRNCRWTLDAGMQLALGNNRAKVRIDGSTTSSVPLAGGGSDVVTTPGGLLAMPTNSGSFEDDVFAVVPQFHAGLAYDLNPRARALVGYRLLYWSKVARSGDQIDTSVNLSQLDPGGLNGEARPRFDFQFSDFWAQGLNVGIDYRF